MYINTYLILGRTDRHMRKHIYWLITGVLFCGAIHWTKKSIILLKQKNTIMWGLLKKLYHFTLFYVFIEVIFLRKVYYEYNMSKNKKTFIIYFNKSRNKSFRIIDQTWYTNIVIVHSITYILFGEKQTTGAEQKNC